MIDPRQQDNPVYWHKLYKDSLACHRCGRIHTEPHEGCAIQNTYQWQPFAQPFYIKLMDYYPSNDSQFCLDNYRQVLMFTLKLKPTNCPPQQATDRRDRLLVHSHQAPFTEVVGAMNYPGKVSQQQWRLWGSFSNER